MLSLLIKKVKDPHQCCLTFSIQRKNPAGSKIMGERALLSAGGAVIYRQLHCLTKLFFLFLFIAGFLVKDRFKLHMLGNNLYPVVVFPLLVRPPVLL